MNKQYSLPGGKHYNYAAVVFKKPITMPWYNGNYPPSYKNQPVKLRNKAVEIANALLEDGTEEGIAIATGLKQARLYFKNKEKETKSADGKTG